MSQPVWEAPTTSVGPGASSEGSPVRRGVHLLDARIEGVAELRELRRRGGRSGGHHHVVAPDRLGAEIGDEPAVDACFQQINPGLHSYRRVHLDRVLLEVVSDHLLAGKRPRVANGIPGRPSYFAGE
jgi:hypothetical protein